MNQKPLVFIIALLFSLVAFNGQAQIPQDGLQSSAQVQLMQMEEEMRKLRGKIEELEFTNRSLVSRLDKLSNEVDFRIKEIEKGKATTAAPAQGSFSEGPPGEVKKPAASNSKVLLPSERKEMERNENLEALKAQVEMEAERVEKSTDRTPDSMKEGGSGEEKILGTIKVGSLEEANVAPNPVEGKKEDKKAGPQNPRDKYNEIFEIMRSGNYDAAILKFEKFVGEHPKDSFSGLALYWLGEIYYTKADYERAAKRYLSSYRDFPKGQRAADSLLKLAAALGKMDKKREACTTIAKLEKEFPKANQSIKSKIADYKKQFAC